MPDMQMVCPRSVSSSAAIRALGYVRRGRTGAGSRQLVVTLKALAVDLTGGTRAAVESPPVAC